MNDPIEKLALVFTQISWGLQNNKHFGYMYWHLLHNRDMFLSFCYIEEEEYYHLHISLLLPLQLLSGDAIQKWGIFH